MHRISGRIIWLFLNRYDAKNTSAHLNKKIYETKTLTFLFWNTTKVIVNAILGTLAVLRIEHVP